MDPELVPERLLPILEQLRQLEPLFHHAAIGTTRSAFAQMITDDFREVGASGNRYSRDFILDTLEQRYRVPFEDVWEARDFHVTDIAADNFLLTYTLIQSERITRRATLWRRCADGWKAVYHQGTVVSA